jgi:hypothetical protein
VIGVAVGSVYVDADSGLAVILDHVVRYQIPVGFRRGSGRNSGVREHPCARGAVVVQNVTNDGVVKYTIPLKYTIYSRRQSASCYIGGAGGAGEMRRESDAAVSTKCQIVAGIIIGDEIVVVRASLVGQQDAADIIVDRIALE